MKNPSKFCPPNVHEAAYAERRARLLPLLRKNQNAIARAEHKNTPLADLKKARWYLDREIKAREQV